MTGTATGEPVAASGASAKSDPTALTTDQLRRELDNTTKLFNAELDVIRERLSGIDRATEIFSAGLSHVPTEVDKQVAHLRELHGERFRSIETQFSERDTRSERESRDNKVAVDAAFAAQKEAASEQNKSNTLAITKSEVATSETLNKQQDLFRSTTDALSARVASTEARMERAEAYALTTREHKSDARDNVGVYVFGVLAAMMGAGGLIAAFLH